MASTAPELATRPQAAPALRRRGPAFLLLLICAAGLALRLPNLELRPVHGDEAVHTVKFDELRRTGLYRYDPTEFHGPTLYYATWPIIRLSGATDFAATTIAEYRLVPVLFGATLILLLALVADGLGWTAVVVAALLAAASPACVFYSRYYIQETLLVWFSFLVIAAGWRYAQSRRLAWLVLAAIGVGCMHATKETAVIVWAAMAGALLVTRVLTRGIAANPAEGRRATPLPPREGAGGGFWSLIVGALVAIATAALLLSGFLRNPRGPLDSLLAYSTYLARAGGGIHTHPWHYYLGLLLYWRAAGGPVWTEAPSVLLAGVGMVAAFARVRRGTGVLIQQWHTPRNSLGVFLAFYALLLLLAYSSIPYKTPWCVVGPLHALTLLAGLGFAALWEMARARLSRSMLVVLLLASVAHLGVQSWRATQHPVYAADLRNPYIYAHPVRDAEALAARIAELRPAALPGHEPLIKVFVPDPWPLPWYLRACPQVGYWESIPTDIDVDADILLVSTDFETSLAPRLHHEYQVAAYGLRRDEILMLYVERGLWSRFMATRSGHD
jgi:uncharacterized protein (TIGR03663 family)